MISGMSTSQIHKELVLTTKDPISMKTLPSRETLRQWKYYLKRKYLPSGDAIANIITIFQEKFLLKISLYPTICIILSTPTGLNLLHQYGQTLYVDGTFSICEEKLILTTIMVKVNEIGIPVTWMLSDSRSTANYKKYFKFITKKTENRLNPFVVLGDFEDALRQAAVSVWPRCVYYGDAFHFLRDNMKWLNSHQLSHIKSEIQTMLQILWLSPSKSEFQLNLKHFVDTWSESNSPYIQYFTTTWINRYQPSLWAYFARGKDIPSGDQMLEGWHNRLQNYVVTQKEEAVDQVVILLWNEWLYYEAILTNPSLYQQRIEEIKKIKRARVTLSNFTAEKNEASLPVEVENDTTELNPEMVSQQEMTSPQEATPKIKELISTSTSLFSKGLCECKRAKINKQCTLKKCLICCSESPLSCIVTSHKQKKLSKYTPAWIQIFEEAMKNSSIIWIKYIGGSKPGTVRAIKPIEWVVKSVSFMAECQRDNLKKRYLVERITDCQKSYFQ